MYCIFCVSDNQFIFIDIFPKTIQNTVIVINLLNQFINIINPLKTHALTLFN